MLSRISKFTAVLCSALIPALSFARIEAPAPKPIYILIYEGVTALDAIGPQEFLASLYPEYKTYFVSVGKDRSVTSDTGVKITADYLLVDLKNKKTGMVVVPGGTMGTVAAARDPAVLNFLKRMAGSGQIVASVCTGALIVGQAGLLRGKKVSSHWALRPKLGVFGATASDDRFTVDGKILSSAGVSAGLDLGLKIVSLLKNDELAKQAQLDAEYAPRPPFHSGTPAEASPATRAVVEGEYKTFLEEVDRLIEEK